MAPDSVDRLPRTKLLAGLIAARYGPADGPAENICLPMLYVIYFGRRELSALRSLPDGPESDGGT
jgi:hypothetical protein